MDFHYSQFTCRTSAITHCILIVIGILIAFAVNAQIDDPVPEPIGDSGIRLRLVEAFSLPPSNSPSSGARINLLREVPDGSGRLFVVDLNGFLYAVENTEVKLYLNLKGEFPNFIKAPGKGTGFGAFCFHPDFAENGLLYTAHSEQAGSGIADFSSIEGPVSMQWVIIEWNAGDPSAAAFAGTRREIMRLEFPHEIHGVQEIAFNPNAQESDADFGMLYICNGEGGSSLHFLNENLQTRASHSGTIFRIDPLGNDSNNGRYGIPPDNPFVDGDPQTLDEIWVYGFRNPHRISWDTEGDKRMFVGDIGEMNIEELNIVYKGHNYGWADREGTFLYDRSLGREHVFPLPGDDSLNNYTYPVAMYDHDEGNAIVAGYVYRGEELPELYGKFICGDIVSGRVFLVDESKLVQGEMQLFTELFFVNEDGGTISLLDITPGSRADLRFGIDNEGEIYILSKADGKVRKMESLTSPVRDFSDEILDNCKCSPNPSGNRISIQMQGIQDGPVELLVYSLDGKLLLAEKGFLTEGQTELNTRSLAPAIYNMILRSDTGSCKARIVRAAY